MIAKVGQKIRWHFGESKLTPERLRGKTFTSEVKMIDIEEKHYGVIASYGQDYISFKDAEIVKIGWNKEKLPLRIITSPLKLAFQLLWRILCAFMETYSWVRFGSQELMYGKDKGKSLVKLIEQNEKLIELWESRSDKKRNP
jgi:hypothetical protein